MYFFQAVEYNKQLQHFEPRAVERFNTNCDQRISGFGRCLLLIYLITNLIISPINDFLVDVDILNRMTWLGISKQDTMRKLWRRGGLFRQVLEHQNYLHQVLEQSS